MWGNIVTIHSVLKKKTTKQIDKDRFGKKKQRKKFIKKLKKTIQGNIVVIHNVLKKKTTELNFQPIQY